MYLKVQYWSEHRQFVVDSLSLDFSAVGPFYDELMTSWWLDNEDEGQRRRRRCQGLRSPVSGVLLQIFGGLVWILVACTLVIPPNPQAWVMFVSVFCFTVTFIWVVVFACGVHQNKGRWAAAVSLPHFSTKQTTVSRRVCQESLSALELVFSLRFATLRNLNAPSRDFHRDTSPKTLTQNTKAE